MDHQRSQGADPLLAWLDLKPGDSVLDVGCGTGVDVAALARVTGLAVGVDRSAAMASHARAHGNGPFAVAEGERLPFGPGVFDAVCARAVLIHTTEPPAVMREIARVVRAGGSVLLSEPDHGTHIVATPHIDVLERLLRHRRTRFRQPLAGRSLPAVAFAAGMTVIRCITLPVMHRSLEAARAAGGPFDLAVDAAIDDGAITADEGRAYLDSLAELDEDGAFLFAGAAVSVLGRA